MPAQRLVRRPHGRASPNCTVQIGTARCRPDRARLTERVPSVGLTAGSFFLALGLRGAPTSANNASWKEIAEVQRRVERMDIATSYRKLEVNHNQRMEDSCFVLCMSARRKHSLMWSHYADGHKGLCIHFSTRVIPIAGACAVEYQRKYPVAMFPAEEQSSAEDLFFKSVLTKSWQWSYEREFRLFSVRMGEPGDSWWLGLTWIDEHNALLPRTAITGITLGPF
jgi:hypothetical protein